ncbi:2-succinyl-5-enolpyruvyl-6-hydroxy-3-cyclohexene-1-carboxylate synthase [Polaribacter pacificus]|uniref:2-succinyl-5-enolpyruvyl-6-hydroxy-3-cyclohexene-1-carboxylate synthase n=1 Tax=Polaribacter pacificus TaxID=1775173 RepID=A0A917I1Q9_9FLAO|nr:2-succinyl-5-enolpyruvyl-6-hydroxy-3-cyclohexene-1-carboxylic-acid synthase [Polaribacter pacificus]GGH02153.1 2-succinyl-5-enolpyruvyl-6-hydroxy-3-cyclohexene-1-carboxylate synthase [Polaribacter pacificus]
MYPKNELAQLVVSACHQYGLTNVVISPGSRNAPLTVGFVNHPEIKTYSIVDERSAGFVALGMAQQTQKPVAVVCSSGSALLNYYPAIAEAFYSNIPLVIISADRPKKMIDIGDGQTIRQENVYENHCLFSANLESQEDPIAKNAGLVLQALQTATEKKGPVHINVPFDEPLYETVDQLTDFSLGQFKESFSADFSAAKKPILYKELSAIWNSATKKMILIGVQFPDKALQKIINHFAEDPSVIILTETTSNVHNSRHISAIDKLIFPLNEDQFKAFAPEVLLTFGGMVVSKKIKQLLRACKPIHHWHVDMFKEMDTFFCLSEYLQEKPVTFLNELSKLTRSGTSEYQSIWLAQKKLRSEKHQSYLAKIPYSDLKVFEKVLASIPNNVQLQVGNSSIIRYAQLFDMNPTHTVFCNRGTSGIDGSTSTAIGAAMQVDKPTVFISGDLSFFYDSNALWNSQIPTDFRLVIINNAGGGIFRFLPGPKTTNAMDYFETPHQLTAEPLCAMHGLGYHSVSNLEGLTSVLTSFYKASSKPQVLEIFTDKLVNETVLKEYFTFLK